ncbi:hypothetical protein [Pseudorhodoplanes sp.]|uniref:hypothetical protein n=1 Tax=Pseudorhodoplanes sp. TaxID=1934341 RepID=UPI002C15EE9D|nr:hypothetical protein [Pseudorhodoplanes sp.]HWV40408.1 hypothetical protein [Pseudorhodoplanes sp.]
MVFQRVVLGLTALFTLASGANANTACENHSNRMQAGALYALLCNGNCLARVERVDIGKHALRQNDALVHLSRGRRYQFLYKPQNPVASNSLVVVQVKRLETSSGSEKPVPVELRRDAVRFACVGRNRSASVEAWPPEGVSGHAAPKIGYTSYDRFHRYGFTNADDMTLLRKFHVRYFNGQSCVSTLDPVRRTQFLFHDHMNYPSRPFAFAARLGLYVNEANAQQLDAIKRYERLRVILTNYQQAASSQGCFEFSVRTGPATAGIDLGLRDLERASRVPTFDTTARWSFDVK